MPRNESVLTVFVASPSDLDPERGRLEEVIRDLNVGWARALGVRLELIRWETHGYPGVGRDAQDVLNRELPDDYDILVGIMWARFGTPTGRAGSGTEEEFRRAFKRCQENPGTVKVMFYFKDAPVAPSELDLDQLASVRKFKASLGNEGVLYWDFATVDEFEQLVRLHFTREIQDFIRDRGSHRAVVSAKHEESPPPENGDEIGFIELLDLLEDCSGQLSGSLQRITDETLALAHRIEERTKELMLATSQSQGQISRPEAKRLFEKAAADMDQYVARVKAELPLFRDMASKSADTAARAALTMLEIDSRDRKELREARDGLAALGKALGGAHESTASFRATVNGLPRLTTALNRSKRETVAVLDELLTTIAAGRRVILEALKTVDGSLATGGTTA